MKIPYKIWVLKYILWVIPVVNSEEQRPSRVVFFSWGFFASWQRCLLKLDATIFPLLPSSVESGSAVMLCPHWQWDHYLSFVIFYVITLLLSNSAYYIYILIGSYYSWMIGKEIIYHISNFDLLTPYLFFKLDFCVCTC